MKSMRWLLTGAAVLLFICVCSIVFGAGAYMWWDDEPDTSANLPAFNDASPSNATAPTENIQPSPYVDGAPTDASNYNYYFNSSACAFTTNSGRVLCGWLNVPENRDDPGSGMIQLAVAIIAPANPPGVADPLVYLEGGPGGQALLDVEYLWLDSPLTQDRTVILIDQRGTGYSVPSLNCPEMEFGDFGDEFDAAQACYDRLVGAGIDLSQYNSEDSAADIRDLILALGYEQADLLGISYGTRLGLTVMRDHPQVVRSVILDSLYPPNAFAYTDSPLTTLRTFRRMFAGCAADPACNAAYPDLETVFTEIVEDLNADPAVVEFWDEAYDEYYEIEIYGDDFLWEMVGLMYSTYLMPYMPAFIYAYAEYDYEYAYDILYYADEAYFAASGMNESYYYEEDYYDWESDISDSEGQYYSVECREEVPFTDYDRAYALASDYDEDLVNALLLDTNFVLALCSEVWRVGEGGSYELDAVTSDIPTLLLHGTYDTSTPIEWARLAAETLPNGQLFEFSGYGHGIIDTGTCATDLMVSFLSAPSTRLNGACVEAIPDIPAFVINP